MSIPERIKRYRTTPKGRYQKHKENAKRRGVEFLRTYTEWLAVWDESVQAGAPYVMCRHGDEGPYAVGNVYIGTKAQNAAERNRWYRRVHTSGSTAVIPVEQTITGALTAPF